MRNGNHTEGYVSPRTEGSVLMRRQRILEVAAKRRRAGLVLKNATYVNVFLNELSRGDIAIEDGMIAAVGEGYSGEEEIDASGAIVLPGLIDAHIHLESSLVGPSEFAKAVLPHGTTTVITDPHEIANVMGAEGIEYILQATEGLPMDVFVMLPSCVPATPLDEAGAVLDYRAIDPFYAHERVLGLAEMMNVPGVVGGEWNVLEKIEAARRRGDVIDGHAPHIDEASLNAYISAGICSDHECSDLQEALAKLSRGMHIMIREGTAARNLDALLPLLRSEASPLGRSEASPLGRSEASPLGRSEASPSGPSAWHHYCMFCTDDIHPSDLLDNGDIDHIIRRAVAAGVDPIIAVKCATLNPAHYFGLDDRGAIAPGRIADLVLIDDFEHFEIQSVYKRGELVATGQKAPSILEPEIDEDLVYRAMNTFHMRARFEASPSGLAEEELVENRSRGLLGIVPGEIITEDRGYADGIDLDNDVLKIIVAERHNNTHHIGIGYIQGYGLKRGAVATSISHDSHNIIAVGTSEADIAAAVNRVVELNGGIVVWDDGVKRELSLQIAGIMSMEPLSLVNEKLEAAKAAAFELGVNPGIDPFMTLSFMALPVIPALRLTTRGVFDVVRQGYV